MNKLFLIDSYALIFRSYYAFINNPMRNAKGMNTSTVFGFTLALDEILRKEKPSHILAAFDAGGPTFRHEIYPEYKANRTETPEDIKIAVPYIKQLLEAFRIPIVEKKGYEADDIIGTIAKQAEQKGFEVYMVTPDKDFAQLVSNNIFMFKPGRSGNDAEKWGISQVLEKFSIIDPDQVKDILALWGDSSDNIPGAPGIGEKTAKKLIAKYGSVENLYVHIDELKGKQKENLATFKDQVLLSKQLATIIQNAEIEYDIIETKISPIDKNKLNLLFDELDFKNLRNRILGEISSTTNSISGGQGNLFEQEHKDEYSAPQNLKSINDIQHSYHLIEPGARLDEFIELLKDQHSFCFDTETTGLDIINSKIVGMSFSWEDHEAYYVAFENDKIAKREIVKFKHIFENEKAEVIGQNLKYDLHMLMNYGLKIQAKIFDTMVAHYILRPERKHSLDAMAAEYFEYKKISTEELIGEKGAKQKNFGEIPPEKVYQYACEDADITWQLSRRMKDEIRDRQLNELVERIEMPLVAVLTDMEHYGVYLDRDMLKQAEKSLKEELEHSEKRIFELAGMEFNVSSPKQLGEVLFEHLKVDPNAKRTKSKQYSTSEDVLVKLSAKHPVVNEVLSYRSSKKLLSTYIEALPKLIHPETGRIHTSFNQTLVATGRLSSNNPNLQNIPIREKKGKEVRRAFSKSSEKHTFLSADYSQIELRLMAHLSQDIEMIEAFTNGEDIHTATAAKVYKTSMDQVTKEMRTKAKTANFGIIYGISAFGLAQRMGIRRTEAKDLIDNYFDTYPGVRKYMDECIKTARDKGYVETIFGRRRYLPEIHSRNSMIRGNAERNAINTPIQGTAADIIKIAMVNIHKIIAMQGLTSKMIIQVHDELNFDVEIQEVDKVKEIVRSCMEGAIDLSVPLIVEMNTGDNWLEAH